MPTVDFPKYVFNIIVAPVSGFTTEKTLRCTQIRENSEHFLCKAWVILWYKKNPLCLCNCMRCWKIRKQIEKRREGTRQAIKKFNYRFFNFHSFYFLLLLHFNDESEFLANHTCGFIGTRSFIWNYTTICTTVTFSIILQSEFPKARTNYGFKNSWKC